MKKLLLILAALSLLLLCGCGEEKKEDSEKETNASVPPMSIGAGKAEPVVPMDEDIVIPIPQP